MYQLKRIQKLPISVAKAWDFFSSPKNLATITPDELGFRIKSELPEKMYPGMFIQYTVKPLLGIPMTWVTEITQVNEPHFFIDEQRVGPYAIWHHQHFFKEIPGGVEMTDIVDYQLPLAPFGNFMQPLLIKGKLKQIFDYRNDKMIELFGEYKAVEMVHG
ncbi:MAG: hypothetical protein AB8G86_05320 [Saprospiraceae bacterium]